MWNKEVVEVHSFAWGYTVDPTAFVEKTIFAPLTCHGTLVEINCNVMVYFWTLNSIPWIVCLFYVSMSDYLEYCSFVVSF